MANLKLVLATGTEIMVDECGVVPHVIATFDTFAEVSEVLDAVTIDGALDTMAVYRDDALLMEYSDVVLDGFQGVFSDVVTLHLYMREENAHEGATEEDLDRSNAYDILFGMNDEEDEEVEE